MAVKKLDSKTPNGNASGRVKFRYADSERYVDLDMENANAAVADGIKSLANALSGRTIVAPARALAAPKAAVASAVVDQEELQFPPQDEQLELEQQDAKEAFAEEPSNGNVGERKKRIPPNPKIVNDLDITGGPMPLKKFVEEKGPRKAQDRLVVLAAWLKKYKNLEEITRDHLYTCYQQMGGSGDWKALNDFDTYVRTLGKRKSWFDKGTNEASFKVTIIASNYVDGMTPVTV